MGSTEQALLFRLARSAGVTDSKRPGRECPGESRTIACACLQSHGKRHAGADTAARPAGFPVAMPWPSLRIAHAQRLRQEDGHLRPGERCVGTEVAVAATGSDAAFVQRFDEFEERTGGRYVVEGGCRRPRGDLSIPECRATGEADIGGEVNRDVMPDQNVRLNRDPCRGGGLAGPALPGSADPGRLRRGSRRRRDPVRYARCRCGCRTG